MAERTSDRNKCLLAMVILMLLSSIGTILVGISIGKPYFNITQNMNLSQVIGRSDLNDSISTNATSPQQPAHLVHGIYGDSTQYSNHPAHIIDGSVPNTTLQQPNWMGSESGIESSGSLVSPSPGSQGWANEILQQLGLGSQSSQSPETQNSQLQGSQSSQLPSFLQ